MRRSRDVIRKRMSPCNVTVILCEKYEPFDPSKYDGLIDQLNAFRAGEISAACIASKLMEALFASDFGSSSPKWDIDCPSCDMLSEGGFQTNELPLSFDCEKKATWDHKDIYSVARSHARITVQSKDLIHIVNHSYYVSG